MMNQKIKIVLFLFIWIGIVDLSLAQDEQPKNPSNDTIVFVADEEPVPTQGYKELYNFIKREIQYPKEARVNGEEGKVFIGFVVRKDGQVSNLKILKGVSPSLDKEAMRIVSLFEDWIPGKVDGKAVNVQMTIPIAFHLGDKAKKKNTLNYDDLLLVVNGKIKGKMRDHKAYVQGLNNGQIESINVLKPEKAIKKYGLQGKNGAAIIILKK